MTETYRLPIPEGIYTAAIRTISTKTYDPCSRNKDLRLQLITHDPSGTNTVEDKDVLMFRGKRWHFMGEFEKDSNPIDVQIYVKDSVSDVTKLDSVVFIRTHDGSGSSTNIIPEQVFNCLQPDSDFDGLTDQTETKIVYIRSNHQYTSDDIFMDIARNNDGEDKYYYIDEYVGILEPEDSNGDGTIGTGEQKAYDNKIENLHPLNLKTPEGYYLFRDPDNTINFYIKINTDYLHYKKNVGGTNGGDLNTEILYTTPEYRGRVIFWTNPFSDDTDGDGIKDIYEYNAWTTDNTDDESTNPNNPDTDGDELWDGYYTRPRWNGREVVGQGIDVYRNGRNYQYCWLHVSPYGEKDAARTYPNVADSDSDGVWDGLECFYGFNPTEQADCSDYIQKESDLPNIDPLFDDDDHIQISWMQNYLYGDFLYGDDKKVNHWRRSWPDKNKWTEEYSGNPIMWSENRLLVSYINMYRATKASGSPKERFLTRAKSHINAFYNKETILTKPGEQPEPQGCLGSGNGYQYFTRCLVYDVEICNVLLDILSEERNADYESYIQDIFSFWETTQGHQSNYYSWRENNDEGSYRIFWNLDKNDYGHYKKNSFDKGGAWRYAYDVFNQILPMGSMLMKMRSIEDQYNCNIFSYQDAHGMPQGCADPNQWIFENRINPMRLYFVRDWEKYGPSDEYRKWHYRRDTNVNGRIEDIGYGGMELQFLYDWNDYIIEFDPSISGQWIGPFDLRVIEDTFMKLLYPREGQSWYNNNVHRICYRLNAVASTKVSNKNALKIYNWAILSEDTMKIAKEDLFSPELVGSPSWGISSSITFRLLSQIMLNNIKIT